MKKLLAILLTFALCFGILSVALAAENEAISTVPDGYTGIYTAEDLDNIRNNLSGKYILMNNVDLSSYDNWNPIGTSEVPFTGELDGNGYAVENMTITASREEQLNAGLFGYAKNATVKNLTIENGRIDVSADEGINAGLVCGYGLSSDFVGDVTKGIINISTKCISSVGGIVGYFYESYSDKGTTSVEKCSNRAEIKVSASIDNEKKYDQIWVGGITGYTNAAISRCSNYGLTYLKIDKVDKNFSGSYIGGICGYTFGDIVNCYNIGDVSVNGVDDICAGGITGFWETEKSISNVYNIGKITVLSGDENGKALYNAIIGDARGPAFPDEGNQDSISLTNVYYLDHTETAFSVSFIEAENIKKLAKEEFNSQNTFIGFDFNDIWMMDEKQGYPVFKWEYEKEAPEPSTNKPTTSSVTELPTEESTATSVATPIEPSMTQPATSEVVTTVKPTEPVTIPVTVPTTAEITTTQPATATTQPVTEPSTTQPVTETESSTVPVTESLATPIEPTTEPDDDIGVLAWLIKIIKMIIDWFSDLFVMLGC